MYGRTSTAGARFALAAGTAALVVVLSAGAVPWSGPASAKIAGTPHDLSGRGVSAGDEVCTYCHTPKSVTGVAAPQWFGDGAVATGFAVFGIRAEDVPAGIAFLPPPRGVSMVCLSCHDGVTAWDALFANPGLSTAADRVAATLTIGGYSNDHPVSIDYPAASDPGVNVAGRDAAGALPLFRDFSGSGAAPRVECASCHNPHGDAQRKFLRMSAAGSGLCLSCHVK